jgi:glycosyltransferase involved in cell wall biosynthesis
LARCVASIRAALRDGDELIVVDSASRHRDAVAAAAAGADVLARNERAGVDRARNTGWQTARHDLVAFVDDDVIVDVGWADAFASSAAAHDAAFITGRLSAKVDAGSRDGNVAVKDDERPATLDHQTRGDLGHGANLLVRRDALVAVGGWDESMGAGARFTSAPEADLFDRLFQAGFTGRYEPAAHAWHEQWRAPRELIVLDWRYGFGNGARLAKLVRGDRARARRVATEAAWSWGLRPLGGALRQRNKTDVARITARLAGTMTGFVRAVPTRIADGHYVTRHNR